MFTNRKAIFIGLGTVLVGGVLLWLTQLGGIELIHDGLKRPTIQVTSFSRAAQQTEFFAAEKLQLALRNIESERVFWIVDEREVISGGVGVEYVFAPNTNKPAASVNDHRIDAIYRRGDSYSVISHKIRVTNARLSFAALLNDDKLSIEGIEQLGKGWQFARIKLANYSNGTFNTEWAALATNAEQTDGGQHLGLKWFLDPAARNKLLATRLRGEELWAELEFQKIGSSARLILAEPMGKQILPPPP